MSDPLPIIGGSLDGLTWQPNPTAPSSFKNTQTGEAYTKSGSTYVRAGGSDVAPSSSTYPAFVAFNGNCNIPDAVVGAAYNQDISISSNGVAGDHNYTYVQDLDAGDPLPDGIIMDAEIASGLLNISGTPTTPGNAAIVLNLTSTAGVTGTLSFGITVVTSDPGVSGYTAENHRAFTAQAVTTAGGEVLSAAIQVPLYSGIAKIANSQTVTAGTPVTTFAVYWSTTSGGAYSDTGVTVTGLTGAQSASDEIDLSTWVNRYVKVGATVTGTSANAAVTSDLSFVVPQ